MKRNIVVSKTEGLIRYFMLNCLSSYLPLYLVTEYPKSGGSWFAQMLADYLDIPFPRNRMPGLRKSIMHGHYLYSPCFNNIFVVLRDGRDVMVSFYYHSYFVNERFNERLVKKMKKNMPFKDYEKLRENLPDFIKYKFIKKVPPRFNWTEFVKSWIDKPQVDFVRYERLLSDPISEIASAVGKICQHEPDVDKIKKIVDKYSFRNLAKRVPGQEDKKSFLRKGVAGDWKNCFNQEAKDVFNYYGGKALIKAGYEQDNSWVYSE